MFEWPTKAMNYEYMANGMTPYIKGVLNDEVEGCCFNWILSNGDRSNQSDKDYPTSKTQIMPEGAHKRIKSVDIIYNNNRCIYGFQFFDKENKFIWQIGTTGSNVETVVLADNEVIIGVVAKLFPGVKSAYSDFQF